MFSLFNKKDKEPVINITEHTWISSNAKMNAFINLLKTDPDIIFVCWFEETLQHLQSYFRQQTIHAEVIIYRQASKAYINNRQVIFAEHYPLAAKEYGLFISLGLKEVIIYNALDEALFQYFGEEKIIVLLAHMGMQENESLEHPMIHLALKNAQEKIAKKITFEQTARSQKEWFRINLPGTTF